MKLEKNIINTGLDVVEIEKIVFPSGNIRIRHKVKEYNGFKKTWDECRALASDAAESDTTRAFADKAVFYAVELKGELERKKPNPFVAAQLGIYFGSYVERLKHRGSERYAKAGRASRVAAKGPRMGRAGTVQHDLEKFIGKDWEKIRSADELWRKAGRNHDKDSFKRQVRRLRNSGQ